MDRFGQANMHTALGLHSSTLFHCGRACRFGWQLMTDPPAMRDARQTATALAFLSCFPSRARMPRGADARMPIPRPLSVPPQPRTWRAGLSAPDDKGPTWTEVPSGVVVSYSYSELLLCLFCVPSRVLRRRSLRHMACPGGPLIRHPSLPAWPCTLWACGQCAPLFQNRDGNNSQCKTHRQRAEVFYLNST